MDLSDEGRFVALGKILLPDSPRRFSRDPSVTSMMSDSTQEAMGIKCHSRSTSPSYQTSPDIRGRRWSKDEDGAAPAMVRSAGDSTNIVWRPLPFSAIRAARLKAAEAAEAAASASSAASAASSPSACAYTTAAAKTVLDSWQTPWWYWVLELCGCFMPLHEGLTQSGSNSPDSTWMSPRATHEISEVDILVRAIEQAPHTYRDGRTPKRNNSMPAQMRK